MNYQHRYHAGNIADVFKHLVLIQVLEALQKKSAPYCVVDSHAATGLYELTRPGEFEHGIGLLWNERAQWPQFNSYFSIIEKFNPNGGLDFYPGSPLIIQHYLRAQDRAILIELHPEEVKKLKINIGTKQIAVHHNDAWNGLKAFLPPKENRGLALIDPPYEKEKEVKQILSALRLALTHWRNGIYLVWYPIKLRRPIEKLHRAICEFKVNATAVELLTLPVDVAQRLNGSGLIIINPPWKLQATLEELLPPLARRLAGTRGTPHVQFYNLSA